MTVAQVNGDSISFGDYKNRLRQIQFDPKLIAQDEIIALKKSILNEMVEEKIISQESEKLGIKVSEEEVQQMIQKTFSPEEIQNIDQNLKKMNVSSKVWNEQIAQKIIAEKLFHEITTKAPRPSDQEITDYYEKNRETFRQKEKVHILQMMFTDKQQAVEAQQKVLDGADFLEVAQQLPEMSDGARVMGDLGFVEKGILPEAIEKKVFGMGVGTMSSILENLPDYYLVKVVEKTNEKQLSLEEARQQIQSMLVQGLRDKFYTAWLHQKTIDSKIKRNDDLLQENFSL